MVPSGGSRRGPSLSFPRRAPPRRSGHLARPRAPRCRRPTLAPDESSRSVRDGVRVDGATARAGHPATRTGAVVNYAEDVHLRDDVPCGCARAGRAQRRRSDGGHPVGTHWVPTRRTSPRRRRHRGARRLSRMPRSATNVIVLGSEFAGRTRATRLSRADRDVQATGDGRSDVPERALRAHVGRRGGTRQRRAREERRWGGRRKRGERSHDLLRVSRPGAATAAWYAGRCAARFPSSSSPSPEPRHCEAAAQGAAAAQLDKRFTAGATSQGCEATRPVEVLSASEYLRFHAHDADAMARSVLARGDRGASLAASNGGIEPGTSGSRSLAFRRTGAPAIGAGLEDG